jgi:putative nucleotidyltransferase with HDIG domain
MPSRGEGPVTPWARGADAAGGAWLDEARDRERAGRMSDAIACYESAIAVAESRGEDAVLAQALRRLGIARHQRGEQARARDICRRSYEVARRMGSDQLAAEALNTIGVLDLTTGSLGDARRAFLEALALGGSSRGLRARVEQNLGILANIQGELDEALARYGRSLDAYREAGDEHGCAIAYHNLGMVSADRRLWDQAERYFGESLALAERLGDGQLQGLCLVNQAEVDVARQRYENALQNAEAALARFDRLGARGPKADAYRVIGMVYRESGRPALAEARLRAAIDLAVAAGSVLGEAEASRELALLYQATGRNQEALRQLNVAYRLFRRLDARVDLVDVGGRVAELEGTYLAVVRAWGESIEASDRYTFGHSERVAQNAVAMARALGLDDHEETTILLGAYLHDVGKLRVPHEILSKPGPLTCEEREVVERHVTWGLELLADLQFPWDIKAIIRWHHERCDGSGYPDRLLADEIPLGAQIVGIMDVYDALTTERPNQRALPPDQAIARITACRTWWSDLVYRTFLRVIGATAGTEARTNRPR